MTNQWISIDEFLPFPYVSVLAHIIDGGLVLGSEDSMLDIVIFDGRNWQQNVGDDDRKVIVSHWMPLPSLPNPANLAT